VRPRFVRCSGRKNSLPGHRSKFAVRVTGTLEVIGLDTRFRLADHWSGISPASARAPSNVVHVTHDNEHGSWLKSEVLRRIRKVGRTLVFYRQQQQIVFLLELQLLQLFACPGWSVNLDFLDAQRSGMFL
jgi:hypothetical protein